jgi:hypothetical protein
MEAEKGGSRKKEEGQLGKEHNIMIHPESHHPRTSAICNGAQNSPVMSEDDKITRRLPAGYSEDTEPAQRGARISDPYDSAARISYTDARQSGRSEQGRYVCEIDLNTLSAFDQILIETAQNAYIFTVTDPTGPAGSLAGGIMGSCPVGAYMLPSYLEIGASEMAHKILRAGAKAAFMIEAAQGLRRLTTSTVISLLHRKSEGAAAPISCRRRVTLEEFLS